MGKVISLDDFRKKGYSSELRPMTTQEWDHYVNGPDFEAVSAAVKRCIEIKDELFYFKYLAVKHFGVRFSHAFQRCTLRMELDELITKYDLVLFKYLLHGGKHE